MQLKHGIFNKKYRCRINDYELLRLWLLAILGYNSIELAFQFGIAHQNIRYSLLHRCGFRFPYCHQFIKGNIPSHAYPKGHIPWSKGLTKETDERIVKMAELISGENHQWYIDGRSANKRCHYTFTYEHRKWAIAIKNRDNHQCQLCGITGCKIHAHHINYLSEDRRMENGICLCGSCHSKTNGNREVYQEFFELLIDEGII